ARIARGLDDERRGGLPPEPNDELELLLRRELERHRLAIATRKKRVEDLERLASSSLSEERRASLHEDLGRRRLGLAHRGWFGGVVRAGCGRLDLPHRRDVLERERDDILLPQSDRPFARSFLRGC